jgi:DNA-binding winged helix-turn-helix (wHTH) protein
MKVAFDRFTFDSETRELLEDGRRVHVSPKAFDLLRLLLERRPKVVSKTELHDRVWPGAFVGDANLSVVVAEIRQVLRDDSRDARFIRTVHRVGYSFSGTVTEQAASQTISRPSGDNRCWLVLNDQTLPLTEGENIVGRDPRCTVWVDASGVSRRHARIVVTPEQVSIEDLDSSNGTFVQGRRLAAPHALADGDEIELGAAKVTFRLWSDERAAKTERIARGPQE